MGRFTRFGSLDRWLARLPLLPALAAAGLVCFRVGRFLATPYVQDERIRCGTPLFLAAAIVLAIGLALLLIGLLLLLTRRTRPIGRALLAEAAWSYPCAAVVAFVIGRWLP